MLHQNDATHGKYESTSHYGSKRKHHSQDNVDAKGQTRSRILEEYLCTISTIRQHVIRGRTEILVKEDNRGTIIAKFRGFAVKIEHMKKKKHDETSKWNTISKLKNARQYINPLLLSFQEAHLHYNISELGTKDFFQHIIDHRNNCTYDNNILTHLYHALNAIEWLQHQGYIHRDIKMENFIFLNNTIKLIDFEFCLYAGNKQYVTTNCRAGTEPYLPPELNKKRTGEPYKVYYTADSYSFAKSFLCTTQLIKQTHTQRQVYQHIFKPMLRLHPFSRAYIKDSRQTLKEILMNKYYDY